MSVFVVVSSRAVLTSWILDINIIEFIKKQQLTIQLTLRLIASLGYSHLLAHLFSLVFGNIPVDV